MSDQYLVDCTITLFVGLVCGFMLGRIFSDIRRNK